MNIPVELNVLWGRDDNVKNFPELGLGLNLVSIKDGYVLGPSDQVLKYTSKFAKIAIIRAGFRHQKPRGGFMYRVGLLIPIVQDDYSKQRVGDDVFYRIYGGISLGWSF
ncbi:hypothetical protein [Pedobacter sp. Leaf194]|uniref:hypothetical protein n=1 Tax=Pedobacter sp. Leaf194 TaxID=1736297 RepID=UPI0012F8CA21|nr:hypothetical protein [Pedobacter sp. Leaf194]